MSDEAKSHHLHAAMAFLAALGELSIEKHRAALSGEQTPLRLESYLSASLANTFRNFAEGANRKE